MTNTAQEPNVIDLNVIDIYLDALNEGDDAARAKLVAQAFTEDARFSDPLLEAAGHNEIAGIDAGVIGADGRLARVVGFFGELSPLS